MWFASCLLDSLIAICICCLVYIYGLACCGVGFLKGTGHDSYWTSNMLFGLRIFQDTNPLCQIYVLWVFSSLLWFILSFSYIIFWKAKVFMNSNLFLIYLHGFCTVHKLTKFFCHDFRNSVVLALIITSVIHYELTF